METKKKILFIGGSLNQTTIMHQISEYLGNYELWFSSYYTDGLLEVFRKLGWLDFSILGGKFQKSTLGYIKNNNLNLDYQGTKNNYDLVLTGSDLIIPRNIRSKKLILVQEGMTDPENFAYYLVKYLKLPRWIASTSTTGMSNIYNIFCVASEGYKDLFIKKGADPKKIIVTGIPNFDNIKKYNDNDFPYRDYVLVATSDSRETFKIENRKKVIQNAVRIANGRQLIFKLHPNEIVERARKEINKYAPDALVYWDCDINPMIANCSVLITQFSTVVYIGIALGKEVYSEFTIEDLKKMLPIQNGGTSARNIANVCQLLLESEREEKVKLENLFHEYNPSSYAKA